jgi:hypothetical protein
MFHLMRLLVTRHIDSPASGGHVVACRGTAQQRHGERERAVILRAEA